MEFRSTDGEREYAAIVRAADSLVVGLDFDGVLAPIVEDPTQAVIHPRGRDLLIDLAECVRGIAVITGRPARQALALGGLEEVGDAIAADRRELRVLGQYGNERWTSTERRIVSPRPPAGLASFMADLPDLLRTAGAEGAWVEEKGLAVAVHTRRLDDPEGAFERLLGPVRAVAERHGLAVEPGRLVIEVRAPGMHKGVAVQRVAAELEAGAFLYIGDDLGDIAAFEAVADLRLAGIPAVLVCSGSEEERALVERADAVVDGPDGVMDFLAGLAADIRAARA